MKRRKGVRSKPHHAASRDFKGIQRESFAPLEAWPQKVSIIGAREAGASPADRISRERVIVLTA